MKNRGGQQMIVHILRMCNLKHPHTWDEILPYVEHIYNKSLHNSIGHNPFQVSQKKFYSFFVGKPEETMTRGPPDFFFSNYPRTKLIYSEISS
jgi:hypothetical protein